MSKQVSPHGVVVGVDGSPSSQVAVRWAAHEAAMRTVPLTVVHADTPLPVATSALVWPAGHIPQEAFEAQEAEGRRLIADAVSIAEAAAAPSALGAVIGEQYFGRPVPTLVDLSKDAQMLVVGCRGRTSRHRMLGSVTSGLIHHAHCPVAVVCEQVPSLPPWAQRPVLVGIDGSRASELAVALAFDEASWRGVDLVALHVWSDADMSTVFGMDCSAVLSAAEKTLSERLAGLQERYPDVTVRRLVEFEHPARHLLEQAESAQLVIVGSHGRGGFAGMLLGSVSTAVAQAAHVPVIVACHQ